MINTNTFAKLLIILLVSGMGFSCRGVKKQAEQAESIPEFQLLIEYLEASGEVINSLSIPSFVQPEEIYQNLEESSYLIVDVRSKEEFARGHIKHSINVEPRYILDFFERKIDPNAFEKIVLVCGNSHLSGYVNAILLTLGYSNVYTLRFGLSAWNRQVADQYWLANISSKLEGQLTTEARAKAPAGEYPQLNTGFQDGYSILRARAREVLMVDKESIHCSLQQVIDHPDDYYLISYWPMEQYEQGHLPGSIQYEPKTAFHSSRQLNTLPTDRPIVLYCYSGQHTAFVAPILRLMGYDAYNMPYGANTFMYDNMFNTQPASRTFRESTVRGFPLVEPAEAPAMEPVPIRRPVQAAQGGC